jgi:hypothetical protein
LPLHWPFWKRLSFRTAFLYFFCFLFLNGNDTLISSFEVVPFLQKRLSGLDDAMAWPLKHAAVWAGRHIFHFAGAAADFHGSPGSDTAMGWVLQAITLVVTVSGAVLWSAIAELRPGGRRQYQTLYAWLRFLLRLTCGMFMLIYGFNKVFPVQMPPLSLAVLNEPMGQSTPLTLLWSLIGLHPLYESICGVAEVTGGVLILFRRTALAGALLSVFVLVNILLYNLFFDVPVKLFAANLLFALLFIILPDVRPLYDFFWRHQLAAPVGIWIPPVERRGFRIATQNIELFFVVGLLITQFASSALFWRTRQAVKQPSPLIGLWQISKRIEPLPVEHVQQRVFVGKY